MCICRLIQTSLSKMGSCALQLLTNRFHSGLRICYGIRTYDFMDLILHEWAHFLHLAEYVLQFRRKCPPNALGTIWSQLHGKGTSRTKHGHLTISFNLFNNTIGTLLQLDTEPSAMCGVLGDYHRSSFYSPSKMKIIP